MAQDAGKGRTRDASSDSPPPPKRARLSPPPGFSFPIHPPSTYALRSPTPFQKPTPLTSFSYSPTRQVLLTSTNRSASKATYHEPARGADLNRGFNDCIWRDALVDEGLDALLDTLIEWERDDLSGAKRDVLGKVGVVSWRGMVSKLMSAVYEVENAAQQAASGRGRPAEGWEMNAMLVHGVLYLEDSLPPVRLASKAASEQSYALQSYYGYSFESYCTSPSFEPPNTNVQWCSVVKTALGNTRIIIGGEVDCVIPGAGEGTEGFVELKTNIVIGNQRDEIMFERQKLFKHYVQSFLLGVPTIVVGFRTRPGILSALQTFKTLEIPRLVRNKPHAWDPLLCLSATDQILKFIISSLHSSSSYSTDSSEFPVFRITFDPLDRCIRIRKLADEEVEEEVVKGKRDEERVGFLLKRWVDRRTQAAAEKRKSQGLTQGAPPLPPLMPTNVLPPSYLPPSVSSIKR